MTITEIAEALAAQFTATRITFHWWNPQRKVGIQIRERFASSVSAETRSITGGKIIYSNDIPSIAEINRLRRTITSYWHDQTRPYSEEGTRLLPRANLEMFQSTMTQYQTELRAAAWKVHNDQEHIVADAQKRLQDAFSWSDYPVNLAQLYDMQIDYPNLQPATDLPVEIYEQQQQLAQAKLQEAVTLFTTAMTTEFHELVTTLRERLTPSLNGSRKLFRDSAIESLNAFFDRFQRLSIGDHRTLDDLVAQARQLLLGIEPAELRQSPLLRQEIAQDLKRVEESLEPLLVPGPRRRIHHPKPEAAPA